MRGVSRLFNPNFKLMEIQNIIDLVETRFLPLTDNISSDIRFSSDSVDVILSKDHVHVMHQVFAKNQLVVISNKEWTSIQYCPGQIAKNDITRVYLSLIDIFESQIKDSKMIVSKREQIKAKITELEKELQECN